MDIELKYWRRKAFVREAAFKKLAEHYIKPLKITDPVIIIFDKRLKALLGNYWHDGKKHTIRLAAGIKQDYDVIKTLLHEIKHMEQWTKIGDKLFFTEGAEEEKKEKEAQQYEEAHVWQAVKLYGLFLKNTK